MRVPFVVLVVGWLVFGCGSRQDPGPMPYMDAACHRALDLLRREKDAGTPCTLAKQHVKTAEPQCPLMYVCPDELDGGSNG